jgi:hypothetical protein
MFTLFERMKRRHKMTLALLIRSVLELAAIILFIAGLVNEKKLIAFENKLMRAVAIHIRNHRRRKALEKKLAATAAQTRAPEALPEEKIAVTVLAAEPVMYHIA